MELRQSIIYSSPWRYNNIFWRYIENAMEGWRCVGKESWTLCKNGYCHAISRSEGIYGGQQEI